MSNKDYPYARLSPFTLMEDFPIGTVVYTTKFANGTVEEHKVAGYIFDGEYWFPAYDTWDGWCAYLGDESSNMYQPAPDEEVDIVEDWLAAIREADKNN